jgi:pimeloyl-ACP methyl ester carboxylesterase
VRVGYADTSFGQVHYREAGAPTGQPLVLIHQSPSSSAMWQPVLERFAARGYWALAPDLLGHGATAAPKTRPDLRTYAAGVCVWLDALGIEQADLVGHHSGSNIALLMAVERPARVHALALWGPALMTPERHARLANEGRPNWECAEEWLGPRWLARRKASGAGWTDAIGRRATIELLQAGPDSQWLHNAVAETPIDPYLPRVSQPVLTLCGEQDTLYAESERAAALVPRGRFEPMRGASLDVADHAPDAFVELVDGFLRGVVDMHPGEG